LSEPEPYTGFSASKEEVYAYNAVGSSDLDGIESMWFFKVHDLP
jgi:hypothetical protein